MTTPATDTMLNHPHLRMICIEGGRFLMGSDAENALSRLELPAGMQALEQLSLNGNGALTRFSLPPGGLPALH